MKRQKPETIRSASSLSWDEREEMVKEYLAGDHNRSNGEK